MRTTVAIVYGGYSQEWAISEKSAKVVLDHLDPDQFDAYLVRIGREEWTVHGPNDRLIPIDRNDFSFQLNGEDRTFDVVFNAIHGTPGEDGKLQGYFDMLGIRYTSPGVLASAITFSKSYCNGFLRQFEDVHIARSVRVKKGTRYDEKELIEQVGLPCFVKPNNAGSSFGVSKVKRAEELQPALQLALEHDTEAVIEQFVNGREFANGVYQHNGQIITLPVTEVISKNDFFDYQAKYEGASTELTPAPIGPELTEQIQNTTRKVFERLNLRGMSRVDYIVQDGIPYLIEVNTIPGLSEASILPQQVKHSGLSLQAFFGLLIDEALGAER